MNQMINSKMGREGPDYYMCFWASTYKYRFQQPFPTQDANHSFSCCLKSWPTGYELEVPTTPYMGLINLLELITEIRNPIYIVVYPFITKNIKWYKSIARWMVTYGEVLSKGASVLIEFGTQYGGTQKEPFWFSKLEVLWTPSFWFFLMEAS